MFSKKTLRFLDSNQYKCVEREGLWYFTRVRDSTWLIVLGGFLAFMVFLANIPTPIFGMIYCLAIAVLVAVAIRLLRKKPYLIIDETNGKVSLLRNKLEMKFDLIREILTNSQFVGGFSSADKATAEEYDITISLKTNLGKISKLFQFKADYEEPEEVIEIVSFLKGRIMQIK